MRKPVLLIWTNAAILIVLFALMSQSLFLVTRIASTKSSSGQVLVSRRGQSEWTPVSVGIPIGPDDVIQTGSDGRAEFAWADGTRWKLEPNTRLILRRSSLNSWRGGEQTLLRLERGKVWVRVVKRLTSGSSFRIETPSAQASVRGTVWSIEVAGDDTRVNVWKGFVDVTDGSREQRVSPGTKAIVNSSGVELQSASKPDQVAFQAQSDLIHPELEVKVGLSQSAAIITGQTEAGDALTLNGEPVKLLSNGQFLRRVPFVRGHNEWKFLATDKHGETSSTCRAAEFDGKCATTSACR